MLDPQALKVALATTRDRQSLNRSKVLKNMTDFQTSKVLKNMIDFLTSKVLRNMIDFQTCRSKDLIRRRRVSKKPQARKAEKIRKNPIPAEEAEVERDRFPVRCPNEMTKKFDQHRKIECRTKNRRNLEFLRRLRRLTFATATAPARRTTRAPTAARFARETKKNLLEASIPRKAKASTTTFTKFNFIEDVPSRWKMRN
jgi:hypothetical protein